MLPLVMPMILSFELQTIMRTISAVLLLPRKRLSCKIERVPGKRYKPSRRSEVVRRIEEDRRTVLMILALCWERQNV